MCPYSSQFFPNSWSTYNSGRDQMVRDQKEKVKATTTRRVSMVGIFRSESSGSCCVCCPLHFCCCCCVLSIVLLCVCCQLPIVLLMCVSAVMLCVEGKFSMLYEMPCCTRSHTVQDLMLYEIPCCTRSPMMLLYEIPVMLEVADFSFSS